VIYTECPKKKQPLLIEFLVGITRKIQLKKVFFFQTPCIVKKCPTQAKYFYWNE